MTECPSAPKTMDDVESRLLTAIKTLDVASDPDRRFVYGSVTRWPETRTEFSDLVGNEEAARERARLGRFRPTAEDVDLMLPTLAWIGPEVKPWLWLLRMRAYGHSYRQIAYVRGRSDEYWRRKYRDLIRRITEGVVVQA